MILFVHPEKTATLLTFVKCGDHDISCLVADREPHVQVGLTNIVVPHYKKVCNFINHRTAYIAKSAIDSIKFQQNN